MPTLNAEENGQICILHFLYHLSAVWCMLCAGEQKNFDFLIIGKKAIEMSVGANRQKASRHDPCAVEELSN